MSSKASPHLMPLGAMSPGQYARQLLDALDLAAIELACDDQRDAIALWAQSGAMWLSGHAAGEPRLCPAPLASCAQGVWLALASLFPQHFDPGFDAFRLLAERAAIAGLQRRGRISAGGACRLLDTADGVIALNLAREDDFELLPAWLEQHRVDEANLAQLVAARPGAELLERARLLGLAVAPMGRPRSQPAWYRAGQLGTRLPSRAAAPLVIDLSSLWAGPLCGQLLLQSGARVIKVESSTRPDGARNGPQPFFHLMNAGKQCVALDLRSAQGKAALLALLRRADIVIEASRPRALQQLGVDAGALVRERPGKVWLSITGYGRREPEGHWVAYGDDAGVAAGLSWLMGGDRGDPVFCGDAIADPLTGLHAALLALANWRCGGGVLLDLSLTGVVSQCVRATDAALTAPAASCIDVGLPVARQAVATAAGLGEHTDQVLAELT